MRSAEGRGEGFVPNVLQQLEGGRSKASIAVQDKGCEGTATLLGVDSEILNFSRATMALPRAMST